MHRDGFVGGIKSSYIPPLESEPYRISPLSHAHIQRLTAQLARSRAPQSEEEPATLSRDAGLGWLCEYAPLSPAPPIVAIAHGYSIGFSAAKRTTRVARGAKSGFAIGSS